MTAPIASEGAHLAPVSCSLVAYREAFLADSGGTLCIVMEYADGGDLRRLIEVQAAKTPPNPPRFPEALVLKWLVQCVSALAFCHHDLKLLHRDIKPANIFLTQATQDVKIGDFGLSKALAASNMQANTRVGSPIYMSPELCQGRPYDRGADVWALGCTFYHVCALKQPWTDQAGNGMMNLVRTILSKPYALAAKPACPVRFSTRGAISRLLRCIFPELLAVCCGACANAGSTCSRSGIRTRSASAICSPRWCPKTRVRAHRCGRCSVCR